MMDGPQYHMVFVWVAVALFMTMLAAIVYFFTRRAAASHLSVAELAAASGRRLAPPELGADAASDQRDGTAHDTIFILPDISNYTKFMTGSQFSVSHAQHVIFRLINAMIDAATHTVELSKLEGDAALFYVDARRHSGAVVGRTVMEIFGAFFRERARLKASNLCPCRACKSIDDLDLKIFIHRGEAARFTFRGSVDHFGTDVIVLHRMMKNGVRGHRYVMVTDAAAGSIALPDGLTSYPVREHVEHVGQVSGTVYEIDDGRVAALSKLEPEDHSARLAGTMAKLGENFRSLGAVFRRTGTPS